MVSGRAKALVAMARQQEAKAEVLIHKAHRLQTVGFKVAAQVLVALNFTNGCVVLTALGGDSGRGMYDEHRAEEATKFSKQASALASKAQGYFDQARVLRRKASEERDKAALLEVSEPQGVRPVSHDCKARLFDVRVALRGEDEAAPRETVGCRGMCCRSLCRYERRLAVLRSHRTAVEAEITKMSARAILAKQNAAAAEQQAEEARAAPVGIPRPIE